MKRQIIMLALISGAVASCNCAGDQSHEVIRNESTVLDSIFLSETLQDTLSKFMADIDSFPNPYGPETVYNITFLREQEDTIVSLCVYGIPNVISPFFKGSVRVLGFVRHDHKIVSMQYLDIDSLRFIVNERIFNGIVLDLYDNSYIWDVQPSIREYKMIGNDSLVLLRQRKSIYERD